MMIVMTPNGGGTSKLEILIVGTGVVGGALIDEMLWKMQYFANNGIRLLMICNSKRMLLYPEGDWRNKLANSPSYYESKDILSIIMQAKNATSAHLVVIDCTASRDLAGVYTLVLQNGISIITANKMGLTGPIETFLALPIINSQPFLLLGKGLPLFRFESTVGAGLPIIKTVQSILKSGDHIESINGILSGTLAFIMNSFMPLDETKQGDFLDILREAKGCGYTEPDPREDLKGMDVARKVTILARMIGNYVESPDKIVCPLLLSPDEDLKVLGERLSLKRKECRKNGTFLRYTAHVTLEKVHIGLDELSLGSILLQSNGCENIVIIKTGRFPTGIIIQGSGAGASATIHGILSDLADIHSYL